MAFQEFRELVTIYDLDFIDLGGSVQTVAQSMQALLEQGNFLKILTSMGAAAQSLVVQASQRALEACQGCDLIIAGIGGLFVGLALSEKLGIPFVQAYYFPFTPTREFPNALVPMPPGGFPAWTNCLTHRVAQQMLWQNYRLTDNRARRQVLRMELAPFQGPFHSLLQEKQTILYGYSPLVIPVPKDWGDFIHVTGYWFLEPPDRWRPPADLLDFLRSGPPPVYIGFGSMVHSKPGETTDLILQALALSGQRGIVSTGWGGLQKEKLPKTVFMIGSIPFNWLFPRMAALVHHGGAGTTSMGLLAGIPAVVTPFMGDQPFWGQRVYELGVGTRPIPRRHLTADHLAESIHQAVSDQSMRERAARLGEGIRAENGIAQAITVIEQRAR